MTRIGLLQMIVLAGASIVAGCATASPGNGYGDGTYLISARAAPAEAELPRAMTASDALGNAAPGGRSPIGDRHTCIWSGHRRHDYP